VGTNKFKNIINFEEKSEVKERKEIVPGTYISTIVTKIN